MALWANRRPVTNVPPGPDAEIAASDWSAVSGGTIGSQSSGAGAGKITFNPFSITRKIDQSSPVFFGH
jgi:type VI protein secretion system component Hcp